MKFSVETSRVPALSCEAQSRRISVLPFSTTITDGPLRLSNSWRVSNSNIKNRSSNDGIKENNTPVQLPRKVRFALPPSDVASDTTRNVEIEAFPTVARISLVDGVFNRNVNNTTTAEKRRPLFFSQRPRAKEKRPCAATDAVFGEQFSLIRRFEHSRRERLHHQGVGREVFGEGVEVAVSVSTGYNFRHFLQPRKVRFALPPSDVASDTTRNVEIEAFPTVARISLVDGVFNRNVNNTTTAEKQQRPLFFSQRPRAKEKRPCAATDAVFGEQFSLIRRFEHFRRERLHHQGVGREVFGEGVEVAVSVSTGIRRRVHPTGRYIKGTLSPTSNQAPHEPPVSPGGQALLRAARDGDDQDLRDQLRRALAMGISESDLNATDSSGRTIVSYVASNGSIDLLELILQVPGLDPNKPDNEGNTPLHFAAQAGQVECLNCLASRCRGVDIDAKNNLGFTPLMKAALQGRNKCAKLLLFAGANPTLRDNGRGFRADQWARFCGRYVCADVIEKHARQRLLERSTSYGNWGADQETGKQSRVVMGKVIPMPPPPPVQPQSNGLRSKLKKVFRTSSGPSADARFSSARLVTQLTSAALCASTPVLPVSGGSVPPVVKSLLRPLTVPRLHITLANNNCSGNGDAANDTTEQEKNDKTTEHEKKDKTVSFAPDVNGAAATALAATEYKNQVVVVKPARTKKKK